MNLKKQLPMKLKQPSFSDVYLRKRLFRLIDSGKKRSVIWITGPPGSGKTILTGSYLEARKLPCLWYQMDESDADPSSFFYYMGIAARIADPKTRSPLPLFTNEYSLGLPAFSRWYFQTLFSRLKNIPVMVLEDYHQIPEASPTQKVMLAAFNEIPRSMNVIVISRSEPPPALSKLLASSMIYILGWKELRLDMEEVKGLVRAKGAKKLPLKTIENLHRVTDGWATGLALILEKAISENFSLHSMHDKAPKFTFDYFAYELFDSLESNKKDFLLKSSILPKITIRMAERITGTKKAGKILLELKRRNYFTDERVGRESVYQYHPLFREFLQGMARDTFSSASLKTLQRKAIGLLEESGEIYEAASMYLQIKDREGLGRLILKSAGDMAAQGRIQVVRQWLSHLPESFKEKDPWFLYWEGVCATSFDPSMGLRFFERAFHLFRKGTSVDGACLCLSGALDAIFHDGKEFHRYDKLISMVDGLMKEIPQFHDREIEEKLTQSVFFALAVRLPHHTQFQWWRKKTERVSASSNNPLLRTLAGNALWIHYLWEGNLPKAALFVDSMQTRVNQPEFVSSPLAHLLNKVQEAFYRWQVCDYQRCFEAVSRGLKISQTTGVYIWDSHILGFGAAGAIAMGDLSKAKSFLEQMALTPAVQGRRQFDSSLYHMLMAWTALTEENMDTAGAHMQISWELSEKLGLTLPHAVGNYGLAQILHEKGDHERDEKYLNQSLRTARRMKSSFLEFMGLIGKAQFALNKGDEKKGLEFLKKALSMGRKHDYINFFFWRPKIMADLCVRALEAGIETRYVRDLIQRRNLVPEKPPLHIENWPWPLNIHTMGRFTILKYGNPLHFSGKAPKKPLTLLKALIAFGSENIMESQLVDALWPEADGDAASQALRVTLHRLRNLLGEERAIRFSDGCVSLDPRICRVDVRAWELLMKKADSLARKGDHAGLVSMLEKALSLYEGHFLAHDEVEAWSISMREHLRNEYVHRVEELGECLEKKGEWKKAIRWYHAGLRIDNLAEGLYQQTMICYQKMGRLADAARTYHQCAKVLSASLEMEPSLKTRNLWENLSK